MVELSLATLCNYAQVDQGLLTMVGGGISSLGRPAYPAPMGAFFVLGAVQRPVEVETKSTLSVTVVQLDGADEIAQLELHMSTNPIPDGEPAISWVDHVVVPLIDVVIPPAGEYEIVVSQGKTVLSRVPFHTYVVQVP